MPIFEPVTPAEPARALFLDLFDQHATTRGDADALIWRDGAMSWRALHAVAEQVAGALIACGGRASERVAVAGRGSAAYVATFIGALKAGMSAVPLSTMVTPDVFAAMLGDSGARFLFADAACAAKFADAPRDDVRCVALDGTPADWETFDDWRARATDDGARPAPAPDDEFNVIYSSGTTGAPKGIVHDHHLRATQVKAFRALGLTPDTRTILTTALCTNYSLVALLATLGAGGAVYLMPRFDEGEFLSACAGSAITHAFLVPVQINRILDHPDFDRLAGQRPLIVFSAGSPLATTRKKEVVERWPGLLVEIYGATEGGASTVLVANQFPDKLGSVGTPSEGCDIRIVAEDGAEAKPGEVGEIVGRAPTMMRGYLNRVADTQALVWRSPDGAAYMRSGDIGFLDPDGFLHLSDRKKDVIISGGLNVFATDIEDVLRRHANVVDCAVVAAPSERWGETPVAFVTPADPATPSASDLRDWANTQLSRHQQIDRLIYRVDMPRNSMGKIVKRELRDELMAD